MPENKLNVRYRRGQWGQGIPCGEVIRNGANAVHPRGKPITHSANAGLTVRNAARGRLCRRQLCLKTGSKYNWAGRSNRFRYVMTLDEQTRYDSSQWRIVA